jgi:hypothetical protein
MHVRRLCAALLTSALAGIGLVAFAAPSYAVGACGAGTPFTGTTAGAVASNDTNWYQTPINGAFTVTLSPQDGDADLTVYDATCTTVLCGSYAGGTTVDQCSGSSNGNLNIAVRYYTGGATVTYTLSASGSPTVTTGPCNTVAGVVACASLTPTSVQSSYTVNTPGSTPASVAGYVNSYEFTLPNGGTLTLPCVLLTVNSTNADACTAAGGRYLGTVSSFSQSEALPNTSLVNPLLTVKVCNADLVATVDGFGVSSFPLVTVC